MSHPGSQEHTWKGGEENSHHRTLLPSLPPPSLFCLHLFPFISFTFSFPSPLLLSLPLSTFPDTLTGRCFGPEIGSGRFLHWHRVVRNSCKAALGMETGMS